MQVMHGVDEDMDGIYKCLKFSYDYMKDEKAKRLFLLSSIFPEDKEISVEILTRLGIGTGLFGEDYGSYDDTRNQVVVAKNKLIDSCLLLDVGERHVKMHDLVRDAAQWIANKEIQGVNLSIKDQKLLVQKEINIKYLLCEGKDMDLFSCKFECSKLEILIADIDRDESQKCMEVPNSFFKNIVKLRILYFTGNEKQPLSLPQSIQSLTNIRSLLVDKVDLGDISVLGKLQSLETLDLVSCTINELPFEITKLGKFKLLNLDNCEIRRNNPFEVIEKCSSLEELYFIESFNGFCREIAIPELQRYHICNNWDIMNYSQSTYLSFCASDDASVFSEATFKYFMRTTEFLRLIGIKRGWRNLMPEIVPIGQGMDDLVELRLSCISQLQCLIDSIGSQVPSLLSKLVVLELDKMENLEELINGSLSFDSLKNLEMLSMKQCKKFKRLFHCKLNFCNLKTLILEKCPMLVSLFPLMSWNLVQLEKLQIADCEELKNIIDIKREEESRDEIEDGDNDNKRHDSIFPKLKVLDIEGCHRLESILPFLSSQDFPVLEAILIRKCDELKYIFSQYQHVELKSLQRMQLCQLPNFIDIFPKCQDSMSSPVSESYSTSGDGFKEQIQSDPIKCNSFSWTYLRCHGDKYGSSSTTRIPLVSGDQPHDYSIASVTVESVRF
ncbi:disease resistance protein RPS2-like isoform X1 [Cicer arietinum]|uniref:disease resistance protein RPS2-like isoform X1 n=1 Tax=Cicer arietinum TaxID=3827 RepID=UPI003CC641BE